MALRSWKFVRAGGFDQVHLASGADLIALGELDLKLWVALACPVKGLEFDTRTLELIDLDKDGRIRAPELIAAANWAGAMLKNPEDLMKGSASLPLSAINEASDEGRQLVATIKTVLRSLGTPDAGAISVVDTGKAQQAFEAQSFNGDGVLPVESVTDEATKAVVREIIATQGSVPDKSGKPGISQAQVDAFEKAITEHAAWLTTSQTDPAILVLKAGSAAGFEALRAVKPKIDDYFARARLAAFDSRALTALNREEKDYLPLAAKDIALHAPEMAGFPLSQIAGGKPLGLQAGLNPAWAEPMAAFTETVAGPLGVKDPMTEAEWARVRAAFAPYETWFAAKAGASVETLGEARVKALAAGAWKPDVTALLVEDNAQKPVADAIGSV